MRRVTIQLDIDRDVRSESILEEVVSILAHSHEYSKHYLSIVRVECGNARTVDRPLVLQPTTTIQEAAASLKETTS